MKLTAIALPFTALALALICAVSSDGLPSALGGAASCDSSATATATQAVMTACQPFVVGMVPLPMWGPGASACCAALRGAQLPCLCSRSSSLSSYWLQLINLQAVKNVLQTCGLQVPSGTTCGGVKLGN